MSSEITTGTSDMTMEQARSIVSNHLVDEVERRIALVGGVIRELGEEAEDFPVRHHFFPGLYAREIHMPKGSIVTSYIHRFTHPYVVTVGDCFVWTDQMTWDRITAPFMGVTMAGTRRLLVMREDTVWTTFHATSEKDVKSVELEIFIKPDNPYLSEKSE